MECKRTQQCTRLGLGMRSFMRTDSKSAPFVHDLPSSRCLEITTSQSLKSAMSSLLAYLRAGGGAGARVGWVQARGGAGVERVQHATSFARGATHAAAGARRVDPLAGGVGRGTARGARLFVRCPVVEFGAM